MFRKLYEWVLHWADTRYGPIALALVSFSESSFLPVPPDPLLGALCLGKPKKSFHFAFLCSVMSVVGGLFGYLIGWLLWEGVSNFFLTYIISPESFNYVSTRYEGNEFLAILGAAMTPIPYKVFTVTAGVFKLNIVVFLIASAIGRSSRFFLEGGLIYFFGDRIRNFVDRYLKIIVTVFFILIVLGFLLIKHFVTH